jgi:hypothetical protein
MDCTQILRKITDIFQIEGTLKQESVRRNMVVYKMNNGGLWCHSVIALNEEAIKQMESWGSPAVCYNTISNTISQIDSRLYEIALR